MKILTFVILIYASVFANINLIKHENKDSNTTLLVIGGIHGDEPGGYFSASILASHYTITSKNLWIVPNLNKDSVQRNSRGLHGDMNRKFAPNAKADKDTQTVNKIKKIILNKQISLVLNLHDGHGFYRTKNQGRIFNPNAWGQTCVIDQCKLNKKQKFGDLNNIALKVKEKMNKKLIKDHHSFNVRNTNTKFDDEAMQLSLTYFAVTNNKPAFAIETSKNLTSLSQKVFYQLMAIEEFMNIMGIHYKRNFELNIKNISKVILDYGKLEINNRIIINLTNIRKTLSYFPLKSGHNVFQFSHPLGSIRRMRDKYIIYIGNKVVTSLYPQYFEYEKNCPQKHHFEVDGIKKTFNKTSDIFVNDDFQIVDEKSTRVNVIGFSAKSKKNESGIYIAYDSMIQRFSIDKDKKSFRIEFYKNNKFCSIQMVHFK